MNGVLNNAAAVLFANRELIEYPQCLLRLARFKGTDKMVFMDNQRVQGNLFQLLDSAMTFIFFVRHNRSFGAGRTFDDSL